MEEENYDFVSRENEDPCFVGPQLQEVEQENDKRLSVLSETTVSAYPDFHKPQEEHFLFFDRSRSQNCIKSKIRCIFSRKRVECDEM